MNENEELTADKIKALMGPPPLMKGENAEEYWKWWSTFVKGYAPKCLSDWLEINELAHKHWEQRRLRRWASALIEGAVVRALSDMLVQRGHNAIFVQKAARDYFGSDPKAERAARETVGKYGITDDQILAEAMRIRGNEMLLIDRMDSYRANSSRLLRKEIDRRFDARNIVPDKTDNQR
jgi:hypothetical protein